MKITLASLALLAAAANAASMSKNVASLVSKSRRLEDADEEAAEEEEFAWLSKYSLKFLGCKAGEAWTNPENGEYEYGIAVYRLCSSEVDACNDDVHAGCKSGYGDYIVGLETFVASWFEDQRDNMEADEGDFNLRDYGECTQYQFAQGRKLEEEGQALYYIAPACASDGSTINLELFSDEECSAVVENGKDTFYELAGFSLPYSDGGLVSDACHACYVQNDNGEYEISDFCMDNYEASYGGGCEENMSTYSANGQDTSSCEAIKAYSFNKSSTGGGGGGWIAFWVILVVGVVGIGGFMYYQKQKKANTVSGSVNDAGLMS